MKNYIITLFLLVVTFTSFSLKANDRYPLSKSIPTEVGVDAKYFEISSVQITNIHKDSLSLKYTLAIFATMEAKKELGFGQYEIKVSNKTKEDLEQLIFPLLTNEFIKKD